MAKTIANVLTGVATLSIRQPNDALAEWSDTQRYAGSYSAKLYKGGSGNAGSTHVEISGLTSRGITLAAFEADPTDYSFWYHYNAVTANWCQFELRFEDPDSDAWAEVTVVPHQTTLGTGAWLQKSLAGADLVGYGGVGELGASFFDWDLGTPITGLEVDMELQAAVTDPGPWILERVRLELWESEPERTAYVDSIEIDGTVYTVEPGGTGIALSLNSPFTELGYTEDGVTFEYSAETTDIMVEEETFPIDRVITKETVGITCNMAESSMFNLDKAMAGSLLSGSIIKLGGGTMKTMNLKLEGTNPAGFLRSVLIPLCTATGTVGMAYKKGEKTIVPVTFQALKSDSPAVTIVENAA